MSYGRRSHVVLAAVLALALSAGARAAYVPWDALVDDSWIYVGPPQERIEMYPVNAGAYEVGFDRKKSNGGARGLNALRFQHGGQNTGHLATGEQAGSFQIVNTGDSRTFADLLLVTAIDAASLGSGFAMSLGLSGQPAHAFDPAGDFAYYDKPAYDTGRPSGYYSGTSPSTEPVSYAFDAGMVTVMAIQGADLGPLGFGSDTVTVDYAFTNLPGTAVFSVYGYDADIGWVYHTNRAFQDSHEPSRPISTFEISPPPSPPGASVPEPATLTLWSAGLAWLGLRGRWRRRRGGRPAWPAA